MGLFLHLGLGRGVHFSAKTKEEKRDKTTGRGYMTSNVCTTHTYTHKYTIWSHSQSQQLALPRVQQGFSDTAAWCMWRGVHAKHFPEPGSVSPALIQINFRQTFHREHTVEHLFVISQQDATDGRSQDWADLCRPTNSQWTSKPPYDI